MIKTVAKMIGLQGLRSGGLRERKPFSLDGEQEKDRHRLVPVARSPQQAPVANRAWLLAPAAIACFVAIYGIAASFSHSVYVELAALLGVTCAVSTVFTRLIRSVAPRLGLVDRPDSRRKLHAREMPLGGGAAIFAATGAVVVGLLVMPSIWRSSLRAMMTDLIPLALASAIIVAVGLADDRIGLRGRHKLLGQCLAAGALMFGGFLIDSFQVFGWRVDLGLLSVPFTLFWLLGAMNALNLLDGIDGLATTVGLIFVVAIAGMATMTGHSQIAMAAVLFAGSLVGFLFFNLPPATIFLGDAGSMLIGLVIGVLSIEGSLKGPGTVLLAAPLTIWTIPVFDSFIAVLRRKLTGRTLYTTDRSHIHHRLLNCLGSNRKVLGVIGTACALTAAAALLSVYRQNDLSAVVTSAAVVAVFVSTGLFGRMELSLLIAQCRHLGRSLLDRGGSMRDGSCEQVLHLQGSREWEALWETLSAAKRQPPITEIRLNINWPAAHEEFHAMWKRRPKSDSSRRWRIEVPLVVAERSVIANIMIRGEAGGSPTPPDFRSILDLVGDFESRLSDFVGTSRTSEPITGPLVSNPKKRRRPLAALAGSRPK